MGKAELWPTSRNLLHTSGEGSLDQPFGGPFGKYLGPMGNDQRILSQWFNEQVGQRRSRVGPQKVSSNFSKGESDDGWRELASRAEGGSTRAPARGAGADWSPPGWESSQGALLLEGPELQLECFESARKRLAAHPCREAALPGMGAAEGHPLL